MHLTTAGKTAKEFTNVIVDYLQETDKIDKVKVVEADSTATNAGALGGVIARFERSGGHKMHWTIRPLHTNKQATLHRAVTVLSQVQESTVCAIAASTPYCNTRHCRPLRQVVACAPRKPPDIHAVQS